MAEIRKLKQNTDYSFTVKVDRNPLFHKKFFALIRLGFENQEQYNNMDHYRKVMIMKAGYYETIETEKSTIWLPVSISFDKMSQDEFEEVFERVLDVITNELGSDRQDIVEQLNDFM